MSNVTRLHEEFKRRIKTQTVYDAVLVVARLRTDRRAKG